MAISVSLDGEVFEQVIYSREDDFEQLLAKNAGTIFGDKTIYINTKKKVNTSALGGTIPDGFLIDLSDQDDPQFYLVEVELQNHDFLKHIFPQITKFFAFFRDSKQRHKLIETIFAFLQDNFKNDINLAKKVMDTVKTKEVYKFLKDTIDSNQNILIVIDGPKPEFEEIIDTYTDTWGKMVKVLIVNHFKQSSNHILTVEPPFQNLPFGDAVSQFPGKEPGKVSHYTEEFHLEKSHQNIRGIYNKLKDEFLKVDSTLKFNPVQSYIGVRNSRKNIAAIFAKQKFLWMHMCLADNEVNDVLVSKHHTIKVYDPGSCFIQIKDMAHWDEIQKLTEQLVGKYQEA